MGIDKLIADLEAGTGTLVTARELASHGAQALPALGAAFAAPWPGPMSPLTCLRMIARDGFVDELVQLAQTTPASRIAVIDALGHGKQPAAVPVLTGFARDPSCWDHAVRALGRHGHADAAPVLRSIWDDRIGSDLDAAVARERSQQATIDLKRWVSLAVALYRLGDARGEPLVVQLSSHAREAPEERYAWYVRAEATGGLAWFPGAAAADALADALDDVEDEVAAVAVTALTSYALPACIPLLLDRLDRDDRIVEAIESGLYDMLGDDGPPEGTPAPGLRRWWMRASQQLELDAAMWAGEPADPQSAIDSLSSRGSGGRARDALELWTGVDFVDDPPEASGDQVDVDRALAWWSEHEADWEVGGLYRAGRLIDAAPIAAALATRAS